MEYKIQLFYLIITLDIICGRSVPLIFRNLHVKEHHVLKRSLPTQGQGHLLKGQGHKHHHIDQFEAGRPEQEVWLDDFTKDFLYEMQADSTGGGKGLTSQKSSSLPQDTAAPRCPPPPEHVPSFGCDAAKCHSDRECPSAHSKCCYNGCTFTCLLTMPAPSVVDWLKEPPRRLQSGNSWLVPGPEEHSQVEPCSTSHMTGEDDLLCPHGFICHIENIGDITHGIPNRGRCVKEHTSIQEAGRLFKIKAESTGEDEQNKDVCIYDSKIIAEGATFWYDRHPCSCTDATIMCRVGSKTDQPTPTG